MRGFWWRATSEHYNKVRLNSAIAYITPKNMPAGRQQELHVSRSFEKWRYTPLLDGAFCRFQAELTHTALVWIGSPVQNASHISSC